MFKKSVFKKIVSVVSSAIMMCTAFSAVPAEAVSYDYHTLKYSAGDVEGVVGTREVSFERMSYVSFDVADSKRFSRKGYTLSSWYVPLTGETINTGSMYTMPDSDITFIANWTSEVYKITFAGKYGVTANNEKNVYMNAECGSEMILPENEFIYKGYKFAGWKYNNVTYQPGDSFIVPALITGEKIVFSAVWKKSYATVTTAVTTTPAPTTTTTITTQATTTDTTTQTTTETTATTATTSETTAATTTTLETTTVTTTDVTTSETTETTTEETVTEITTDFEEIETTTETETTAVTIPETTTTTTMTTGTFVALNDSQFTKTIDVEAYGVNGNAIELNASDLISANQIVESIEVTLESENSFGLYGVSFGFSLSDNTWYQENLENYTDSNEITVPLAINEANQNLITPDGKISIGCTADNEAFTVKSIKVNYRMDKGDYNNDGVSDNTDVQILKDFMVGINDNGLDITTVNGDINNDGVVNVFDYIFLSRMINS
ncbi:MAG: hypothetical protein K2G62_02585 [Oscillospiraceae bacterium]|nr:hypothetical protein [Oscillospiraceae bacterium]